MRTTLPSARLAALLLGGVLALAACSPPGDGDDGPVALDWSLTPTPATVGPATVHVALRDTVADAVVTGAAVHVEGNMAHAGMQPSLSDAEEVTPGRYEARLDFTMGGDWYLLFDIQLADGTRLRRKVDVPGVRAGASR